MWRVKGLLWRGKDLKERIRVKGKAGVEFQESGFDGISNNGDKRFEKNQGASRV